MKTQHTLIVIIAIILSSLNSIASHNAGGEISYTHLTGNEYLIRCTIYRDCFGIPAPTAITVTVESATCSFNQNITIPALPGTGQEITQICPTANSTCSGGNAPGFQKWEYEGTIILAGQCPDWIFHVSDCCRNASITTLSGAAGLGFYMEARLDNQTADNSSPQFTVDPFMIACVGQDLYFNNGLVDPDGDSLAYVLIAPRVDGNTNAPYLPGYSPTQPISSTPPVNFNSITGDLFIHPTALEVGVIVYLVQEFRNGILIGSVMRDVRINIVSCTNDAPFLTGINGTSQMSVHVLPNVATCFDIFSFDNDPGDSLRMSWNSGISNANFTSFPNPLPTGTFCWTPGIADVRSLPYTFCVTISDNNCPENNLSVYSYTVYVTLDTSLVTPLTTQGYITGKVYFDIDASNSKDSLEPYFPYRRVDVQPDNIAVYSAPDGEYRFYGWMSGTHNLILNPPNGWSVTEGASGYAATDDTIVQAGFDFGLNSVFQYNQVGVSLVNGPPRCNTVVNHWIEYENTGFAFSDGRLLFILDTATTFFSSNPLPDSISGDTLIYNFTDMVPFNTSNILVQLQYPGAGDTLDHVVIAQYDSAGIYYTSGMQDIHTAIVCSFDPNDKSVLPEGLFSDHRTLYTDPLTYTIRFQNTGTDTAFTVFIQDFIDPSLDISTLHIMGSSHDMTTTIFPNRMVEFRFENILLPDSNVDYLASQGYVQYKIEPKALLLLPVVVNNQASIFFDSNMPVVTNNVWNTLVSDLYVGTVHVEGTNETIGIIPNPFSNSARMVLSKSFTNTETTFLLMDAMGRIVDKKSVNASEILITKGNLNSGIYFFELRNQSGKRATGKLIME